jgi:hypothetical protein
MCVSRFNLEWSLIEFSKTDLVVCENVGTLTMTLERSGALTQMAFVAIQVRGISARAGEDFIPSTAQQVQFEPGTNYDRTYYYIYIYIFFFIIYNF